MKVWVELRPGLFKSALLPHTQYSAKGYLMFALHSQIAAELFI